MSDEQRRILLAHIKAIGEVIPSSGGSVSPDIFGSRFFCIGDEVGLCRLGLAILAYAASSHIPQGETQGTSLSIPSQFGPGSRIQKIMLQVLDPSQFGHRGGKPARWLTWWGKLTSR